jgi:PTS system sorbose-specific IIB component
VACSLKKDAQITKAISVFPEDVAAFRELIALGVELDCRVVATDNKVDFEQLLKEKFS